VNHPCIRIVFQIKRSRQNQRPRRREGILLYWVLLNTAWVVMLSSGIISYHLCRMFSHH